MSRPSRRKTKAIQASQTTRERKNAAAKGRPIYFLVVSTLALVFFVHFISGGGTRDFPTLLFPPLPESSSPQQNSQAATAAAALPTCTEDQIASIKAALSDHCKGLPFYQKCAYTRLTKCPNQTWLDAFHKERFHHGSEGTPLPSYIGISVGCNKGMDALNSLRVGSQNDRLDKEAWKKEFFSGKEVHAGVCGQEHEEQVRIEENSVEFEKGAKHQMYCIEAMPSTADTLAQTAKTLGYDELGMTVINAAGGIQDGVAWFPNLEKSGVENQGMATCGANSPEFRRKYCTEVAVISLDSLATKYIGGFENDLAESVNGYPIIQTLNIDVEGCKSTTNIPTVPSTLVSRSPSLFSLRVTQTTWTLCWVDDSRSCPGSSTSSSNIIGCKSIRNQPRYSVRRSLVLANAPTFYAGARGQIRNYPMPSIYSTALVSIATGPELTSFGVSLGAS
jgi:hypothetical protein